MRIKRNIQICACISEAMRGINFRAGIILYRAVLRLQIGGGSVAIAALFVEIRMCKVAILPIRIQCLGTLSTTKAQHFK